MNIINKTILKRTCSNFKNDKRKPFVTVLNNKYTFNNYTNAIKFITQT